MGHDRGHESFPYSSPLVRLDDEDIGDIGERGQVADDPSEPDLAVPLERSKAERPVHGASDGLPGNALGPVRAREVAVDHLQVEP